MLSDADQSLASWLRRLLPSDVGIRFEPPDPQWVTKPPEDRFVNAFLHAIRQDSRGQQSGWSDLRDEEGRVVGRRPAAQYYRLAYLATVWVAAAGAGGAADRIAAEHEILGGLLNGCAQQGVLPLDCLRGSLAEAGVTTVLECSPVDSLAATGTLWSGFGLAPRAFLELVLVAPAAPPVLTEIAPPAREIVLSAGPDVPARAAAPAAAQQGSRPFGTLRRWEKQTTIEPSSR